MNSERSYVCLPFKASKTSWYSTFFMGLDKVLYTILFNLKLKNESKNYLGFKIDQRNNSEHLSPGSTRGLS